MLGQSHRLFRFRRSKSGFNAASIAFGAGIAIKRL